MKKDVIAPQPGMTPTHTARTAKTHPSPTKSTAHKKGDPLTHLQESMARAGTSYPKWNAITTFPIWNNFRLPAQLLYEFLQKCPATFPENTSNLREEMLDRYRNYAMDGLTELNFLERERRFMTLVQAASFMGAVEFLREKNIVLAAYALFGRKTLSVELKKRVSTCERFHQTADGLTPAVCEKANYTMKIVNDKRMFVHPETGDMITMPGPKLKGGALLSPAENARRAEANRINNEKARMERRGAPKKPKASKKPEEDEKGKTNKKHWLK